MKNDKQTKNSKNSFLKENGFLIALYSVVGVLVVVAVSLTFFMPTAPKDETLVSLDDTYNVSNNLAKSYKTQVGTESGQIGDAQAEVANTEKATDKKVTEPKTEPKTETKQNDLKETEKTTTSKVDETPVSDEVVIFEDDQSLETAQPATTYSAVKKKSPKTVDAGITAFSDDMKMIWPTQGEVVAKYSPDTLVYDQTLDQYKTNDSIDIATEKGQDVFVAYDGVVKEVSNSIDQGNYVVVDHGNGWVTTYSQLDDSMKVTVGDQLKKGQQIGVIAAPSNQSVALGTHLDFKVTKDEKSVDPLVVLEQ